MSIYADPDLKWDVYIQCDYPHCRNGDTIYNIEPECTDDDGGKWDAQEQAIREFEKDGWQIVRSEYDIPKERKHYCPDHNTPDEKRIAAPKGAAK